jgi:hypothetical protein
MSKTITLENPLVMIGRYLAKKKIVKINNKIAKLSSKKANLENKYKLVESTNEVVETKATTKATMTIQQVESKFGNKIIFKKNMRNSFYHADKGMIDGKFLEFAESTKWLNVSPNPKNSNEMRVFFNHVSNGQKSLLTKHAKSKGWAIEFA